MTALSVQPPFPIITGLDGQPLEDGYIWIGVANLQPIGNPIAVYWDAGLTIPAPLPIRTQGGYPVNSGTPARLYVGSDYSIQVQDKNGSVAYTSLYNNGPLAGGSISSVDVSFLQAGSGAVERTAQSKMRDVVSVKDFGAVGDGITDDAAAVQAAFNTVTGDGGTIVFPQGTYLFGSQVTLDRTTGVVPPGNTYVGENNVEIIGYGAEIRTTGAIYAFRVKGNFAPYQTALFEGFTIYHRNNTTALGGINIVGAPLVTCRNITVVVSSSLPANYASFRVENSDPTNTDTGSFWTHIDHCSMRPWAGAEGFPTYGVHLLGTSNATRITGCMFSGANTHVRLEAHPGQTLTPNAVVIDGNSFETPNTTKGIVITGAAAGGVYHVSGTRIVNNRFESVGTAVELNGAGSTVQLPTYMAGNYADTSIPNYLVNTLNIPVVMLDFVIVGATMGPAKMHNQAGVIIENDDLAFNPLTIKTIAFGKGLELRRQSGNVLLGNIGYSNAAGGNGMQLAGAWSPDYRPLTIKGCQGIAARDTSSNNLAGTSSFSASTTKTVSLPIAETDGNYLIFLMPQANQKLWITARTAADFTVESDASTSNSFGWLLIRHV